MFAIDGNFVSNRKDKNTDPNDFPLSKGAAYFVHEGDVARYLPKLGDLKIEVRHLSFLDAAGTQAIQHSTCNKFGAMGYSGHWGAVSGMILLTCSRHNFILPASAVDLQKGER